MNNLSNMAELSGFNAPDVPETEESKRPENINIERINGETKQEEKAEHEAEAAGPEAESQKNIRKRSSAKMNREKKAEAADKDIKANPKKETPIKAPEGVKKEEIKAQPKDIPRAKKAPERSVIAVDVPERCADCPFEAPMLSPGYHCPYILSVHKRDYVTSKTRNKTRLSLCPIKAGEEESGLDAKERILRSFSESREKMKEISGKYSARNA